MANYQGLNCIMPEITMMASNEKNPVHEQHIYDYFTVTEKFVRTAVPQLFMDCMTQFEERLVVEFETYLNGQKIHHDDIAKGISEILHKSIGDAMKNIKISKKKPSRFFNLNGFTSTGDRIRTNDTSGMKDSKLVLKRAFYII